MLLDLETDDLETEVDRLEALGAKRWDHQQERGFEFWVLHDPWSNEFCVFQTEFPELLARQEPWNDGPRTGQSELWCRSFLVKRLFEVNRGGVAVC